MRLFYLSILFISSFAVLNAQRSATYFMKSPEGLVIEGLDGAVISSPVLSPDGQKLFWAFDNYKLNCGDQDLPDIWMASRQDTGWSTPVNVGSPLNDFKTNKPVSYNIPNSTIFTVTINSEAIPVLQQSSKTGRSWSTPQRVDLPKIYNDTSIRSVKNFFVSADGQFILFTADTHSGKSDIYYLQKRQNGWSAPSSLGSVINSDQEEWDIHLAPDNKTLYFSSNGHTGMGGYDIYISQRLDETWLNWTTPKNLGPKINSPADEKELSLSLRCDEMVFTRITGSSTALISRKLPWDQKPEPFTFLLFESGEKEYTEGQIMIVSSSGKKISTAVNAQLSSPIILPGQTTGLIYFAGARFFGEAFPVNVPMMEDIELQVDWQALQEDQEYLEREKQIKSIQESILGEELASNKLISQKIKWLENYQQWLPLSQHNFMFSDKTISLLEDLKRKYQQLRLVLKDTVLQHQLPDTAMLIKEYQQKKLKERFEKIKQAPYQMKTGQSMLSNENDPPAEALNINFKDLLDWTIKKQVGLIGSALWQKLQGASLDEVKAYLEPQEQVLLAQLLEDEEYRSIIFGNRVMESLFYQLSGTVPEVKLPWQLDILQEIEKLVRPVVSDQLPALFSPYIDQLMEINIHQALLHQKKASKVEERQELIALQMAIEQRYELEETIIPDQLDLISYTRDWVTVFPKLQTYPLTPGTRIPLRGITFQPGSSEFGPTALLELNRLADILESDPNMRIELDVFSLGAIGYSSALQLTQKRVEAIITYLKERKVDLRRIKAYSKGKYSTVDTSRRSLKSTVSIKIVE